MDAIVFPCAISNSESKGEDGIGLSRRFDLDLIDNSEHEKRYHHLFKMASLHADIGFEEKDYTYRSLRVWFLVVLAAYLLAYCSSYPWLIKNPKMAEALNRPIHVSLLNQTSGSNSNTSNTSGEIEIKESVAEVESAQPNYEPLDIPIGPTTTESETITQNPKVGNNKIDWQREIKNVVEDSARKNPSEFVPESHSLRSRGTIFGARLQQKFNSPLVTTLNRWQLPSEKVVNLGFGSAFFVMDGKCYITVPSNLGPGFVENLTGNIDCKKVFYQGRITREELKKSER